MSGWEARCPAKINTFLAVGPPGARGYHPLRTVFQAVDLCDVLRVRPSAADVLNVAGAHLPANNTLTKTLRLVRELLPVPPLEIQLQKVIPSQAGLGGGSSDAAGLIRILMKMLPDHFEERFAFEVAEAVGADVSFFLVGGRAKGEGYGQVLTPLPDAPEETIIIAMPADVCSTVEAYRRLDEVERPWSEFPENLSQWGVNDFERVAPCGSLDLIDHLRGRGAEAMLTGSGSAVVARGMEPELILAELKRMGIWATAAKTLSRSESLGVNATWTS